MSTVSAFTADARITTGGRADVAAVLRALPNIDGIFVFDDASGRQIELELGETGESAARRGRPSLGVVAREVTLLPRHWDWLATQSGGASATIRRLIEAARKADDGGRAGQDAAYHFLYAIAGDRPGYEEAMRALFAGDRAGFAAQMAGWPAAIRDHALRLAANES